eukprot:260820-Chlamydomonas_euryale.AAC.2
MIAMPAAADIVAAAQDAPSHSVGFRCMGIVLHALKNDTIVAAAQDAPSHSVGVRCMDCQCGCNWSIIWDADPGMNNVSAQGVKMHRHRAWASGCMRS